MHSNAYDNLILKLYRAKPKISKISNADLKLRLQNSKIFVEEICKNDKNTVSK